MSTELMIPNHDWVTELNWTELNHLILPHISVEGIYLLISYKFESFFTHIQVPESTPGLEHSEKL